MDIRLGAVQEADVTMSATGHDHSGAADGSTLGLDALQVDEQSAENAGAVTVLVGTTEVIALPSMNVLAGDRILVNALFAGTKGVTAGDVSIAIQQLSGTATIQSFNDKNYIAISEDIAANKIMENHISGMFKVTVSGTSVLRLWAASAGSNVAVLAGDGQIHALVLRGTG